MTFKTKPQIALEQLGAAWAAGVARGAVLFDASYGSNSKLRSGVSELGLSYVAAVVATVKLVAVPKRAAPERRMSVKALAQSLSNPTLGQGRCGCKSRHRLSLWVPASRAERGLSQRKAAKLLGVSVRNNLRGQKSD